MTMLTRHDAEDAILQGQAEAEEFMQEFLKMWEAGGKKRAMRRAWTSIPADLKDRIKARNPDHYKTVTDYLSKP